MLRRIDRIAQHVVCAVEPQLESYPCAKAATAVEPLEAERAIPPFVTEAPSPDVSADAPTAIEIAPAALDPALPVESSIAPEWPLP